ncbi:GNAT family N-acetyltransferase [Brevibacillus fortis]|uniref:GNAT family N-acetyltransferase n=1 Tax=Brevibacillus fortis TaxID=2126352 RepID=A0A2P7VHE2_9BACL|nr:GNAT family N-acetyltransferase [Brevibacillus fortis]PSJ98653.1 GNAT family N-acetyltransferase [Brevibacillus fortis]
MVPTTRDNWQDALRLQVHDEQQRFVPSVAVSLAKVHIRPDGDDCVYEPFCLYGADKMVGFVMITYDASTDWCYWFNGFFIDQQYQGKGYGRAALVAIVDTVRNRFPQSRFVNLTVWTGNASARHLYSQFGFEETGDVYDGEIVYRLSL